MAGKDFNWFNPFDPMLHYRDLPLYHYRSGPTEDVFKFGWTQDLVYQFNKTKLVKKKEYIKEELSETKYSDLNLDSSYGFHDCSDCKEFHRVYLKEETNSNYYYCRGERIEYELDSEG